MKKLLLCGFFVLVALFTGCGGVVGGTNVEELLRAPQASPEQRAVQTALNSYLGETVHLKYPRGGTELSPMLFADFDGDNVTEAAVLYVTDSKGRNVHLAMLEPKQTSWEVVYEIEGLSSEIAELEIASLTQSGSQLIVGYANATLNDTYLAVYDYHAETITRMYEQSYAEYLAADFTGAGQMQLIVVPPTTQPGALTVLFLQEENAKMKNVQTLLLDERFVTCTDLYASRSDEVSGLVIDGTFTTGGIASQVLRLQGDQFVTWPAQAEIDVPQNSLRFQQALKATDFEGYGTVEVPTKLSVVPTLSNARRFYYITWRDYLAEQETPRFGVYDAVNGYFMQLPNAWENQVHLVDGMQTNSWQVRSKEGNQLLLSVRIENRTASLGSYSVVGQLGENSVRIFVGENATAEEAMLIRTGITVLQ